MARLRYNQTIMTRKLRRLLAIGWPRARPSRGVLALGSGSLALALIPVAIAQSRRLPPDIQARRSRPQRGPLRRCGKHAAKMDGRDPQVAALLRRALSALAGAIRKRTPP